MMQTAMIKFMSYQFEWKKPEVQDRSIAIFIFAFVHTIMFKY